MKERIAFRSKRLNPRKQKSGVAKFAKVMIKRGVFVAFRGDFVVVASETCNLRGAFDFLAGATLLDAIFFAEVHVVCYH